jgi:hypothetical protein
VCDSIIIIITAALCTFPMLSHFGAPAHTSRSLRSLGKQTVPLKSISRRRPLQLHGNFHTLFYCTTHQQLISIQAFRIIVKRGALIALTLIYDFPRDHLLFSTNDACG